MGSDNRHGKALADLVMLHRVKAKLSLSRAAELAGMNRATWTDLEDPDARLPRPETLQAVAEVLDIDVEQLLVAAGFIDPVTATDFTGLAETLQAMTATVETLEARVRALELQADPPGSEGARADHSPSDTPARKRNRQS